MKLRTQSNGCLDVHSVKELLDHISVTIWEIAVDNEIECEELDNLLDLIEDVIVQLELVDMRKASCAGV